MSPEVRHYRTPGFHRCPVTAAGNDANRPDDPGRRHDKAPVDLTDLFSEAAFDQAVPTDLTGLFDQAAAASRSDTCSGCGCSLLKYTAGCGHSCCTSGGTRPIDQPTGKDD